MSKNSLENVIAYIVKNYPHKGDLSNARVTKMIFLADWYRLINGKTALTDIQWYFDNYGPFVWDVKRCVENSNFLSLKLTRTMFGNKKEIIELKDDAFEPRIGTGAAEALDHIIDETKALTWSSFIQLVYSTYPVASSEKYTTMDLPKLAAEYTS